MEVTAAQVQALRKATGAGMMDCKRALAEAGGDQEKATEILRKKGAMKAAKRKDRETREGLIHSYIHMGGKIGVLVEANCETDFVARTDEFRQLAKDVAMHIAASDPEVSNRSELSDEVIEKEREIYREQAGIPVSRKRLSSALSRAAWKNITRKYVCWTSCLSRTRTLR